MKLLVLLSAGNSFLAGPICKSASFLSGCSNGKTLTGGNGFLHSFLNTVILVAGALGVIFLLVGGINFITSEGDSEKAERARKTIQFAVIGLIVVASAEILVGFVLNRV